MSDQIKVDIAILEQDIGNLQETLKQILGEMNGMYEAVAELSKTWSGASHTAFVQQFENDTRMFGELQNIIAAILKSMEQAKDEYRSCEQKVRAEIEGIRIA